MTDTDRAIVHWWFVYTYIYIYINDVTTKSRVLVHKVITYLIEKIEPVTRL